MTPQTLALLPFLLCGATVVAGGEVAPAVFDSAGKLTAIVHDGDRLAVEAGFHVLFEGAVEVEMQPHDQRSPISREGLNLAWTGRREFPNGAAADFAVAWTTGPEAIALEGSLSHDGGSALLVEAVDYVIDLPRDRFAGGSLNGGIPLTVQKAPVAQLFAGTTDEVTLADSADNWTLRLSLDQPRKVFVSDHWGADGRSYRVRVRLLEGAWEPSKPLPIALSLSVAGRAAPAHAELAIDPDEAWFAFDGYGANLCWGFGENTTEWIRERLPMAWTRHEWKLQLWDRERQDPGEELVKDFARIQEVDAAGQPWIVSLWRLPERFLTQSNQVPRYTFGRKIRPERWPELLDLMTSYLAYLKDHYGAVPDYVSFNEPDLGVNLGLSPEEHRDTLKRIVSHLRAHGFPEIQWVLGETANPRDAHTYILATAADPEAMALVGAISFHSWMGARPEQFAAWSEVARWLDRPLIVGEAGDDPGSWRNRSYDNFDYGLHETALNLKVLRFARPQASLYWQFTADYGLVREEDGTVTPTGRFDLMRHFTNLTPQDSVGVASSSDLETVHLAAFTKGEQACVHILNEGPAATATIRGLPAGTWVPVVTTERAGYAAGEPFEANAGPTPLDLPARSLTTLVRGSLTPNGR